MLLLALALAPGIAISLFIILRDQYNREPRKHLIISFFLGVLSAVIALILETLLLPALESTLSESIMRTALKAFIVVALVEEWSKYIMVRYYAFRQPEFDEPYDGIVYAVMVSMGFATIENVAYVMEHGLATAILRMFLSVPAHACFGVLMGYFMGVARFKVNQQARFNMIGLLLACFFHGLFDFFLMLQENSFVTEHVSGILLFFGAIASFFISLNLSGKAVNAHLQISKNMHGLADPD